MPTYVYACQMCGAQFEQFQRFSDEPLTVCPRCQGALRRVFQPVGIVFKGSGWYVTDSRNTTSSTTPAASTESKPDTTEAAPAAPASEPAPPAASPAPAPEAKPVAST